MLEVGDIASNVESDWTGQIIGFESHHVSGMSTEDPGDVMAVMLAVSFWPLALSGEVVLDADDKQWQDVRDLKLILKGENHD